MMHAQKVPGLWLGVAAFVAFVVLVALRQTPDSQARPQVADRIVISAPIQVLMSGGDQYLAADLEAIRAVSTGSDDPTVAAEDASFRIRAHRAVAQLNPCHEDNYYLANAMLSWGGAPGDGFDVLHRAMDCRYWDEVPAFFYGFNQWFFRRDGAAARKALEAAARRSTSNAAALSKLAIMIGVREYSDDKAALRYLEGERDRATDPKLRQMLDKRVRRLLGLIQLRDAQRSYESQTGHALLDPSLLIASGVLAASPVDPMGLGYEFVDGTFRLRTLRIGGLGDAR